jgi:hypothetical protein
MKRWILRCGLALAFLPAAAGMAAGQASPNFDLSIAALTGGGGRAASAGFLLETAFAPYTTAPAGSASFLIDAGFLGMAGAVESGATPDGFEQDDACAAARPITLGSAGEQTHTFHRDGDQDWLRFDAIANKSYVIRVTNLASGNPTPKSDAVILLHDECGSAPGGTTTTSGAFGAGDTVTTLEWDSTRNGPYYVLLQQFDPSKFGEDAAYKVTVSVDQTPPDEPLNPRCEPQNATTLNIQWTKSTARDVRKYRIQYAGDPNGSADVPGGDTTYYQLGGLVTNRPYTLRINAVDYSGNESPYTGEFPCTPKTPGDATPPSFSLQQPAGGTTYTTSADKLTFTGSAQDGGNNLSRTRVLTSTEETAGWDYSLSGGSDDFRVEDVVLNPGLNVVKVSVYDAAGNVTEREVRVTRTGATAGAVIVIAGHNESFGLQTNIYNMANRAVRIFKSAGYNADTIHYLAPVNQDAEGDGTLDTDGTSTPANVEHAIKVWAAQGGKVGPNKPLYVYMVDHGFEEKFCGAGCTSGAVTPQQVDEWLRALETATGLTDVTIVMEACRSGSFIDRAGDAADSLSKANRVLITSTSAGKNAYASSEGGYFSDAFFSCLADSSDLRTCFEEARAAVLLTGVQQEPWLDDNGDALSSALDGALAQSRVLTKFFSSIRPAIVTTALEGEGETRTLEATVNAGAEEIAIVWAVIFPPGFEEPPPGEVTLNLGVPIVRLEQATTEQGALVEGKYTFTYNGFTEPGDYKVIFYAQDRLGISALPKPAGEQPKVFLPTVSR